MTVKGIAKYIYKSPSRIVLTQKSFFHANSLEPLLSYGLMMPQKGEIVGGGRIKHLYLSRVFPEQKINFNILYLISSALPYHLDFWVNIAKKQGIPIVLNQNGVVYRGWFGNGWEIANKPLKKALHNANYIFYQSIFCKIASDKFLGIPQVKNEVLYNAVDTELFFPRIFKPDNAAPVLLLGGSQCFKYRFEFALKTTALIKKKYPDTKLLITGNLSWIRNAKKAHYQANCLISELKLERNISFTGPYSQEDAPEIFRKADIFLHTQYNDACPTTVVEAMACGLPIVYSDSGGVGELVGHNAGIGIQSQKSWQDNYVPDPELFANAVITAYENRKILSICARERAIKLFDIKQWYTRHRNVFQELLIESRRKNKAI